MTHDELVRFAARKVGAETRRLEDGRLTVFSVEISEVDGEQVDIDIDEDLTSPELLFKGLGVCPHAVIIHKDEPVYGYIVAICADREYPIKKSYATVDEIPLLFWQCWAELEGGQL